MMRVYFAGMIILLVLTTSCWNDRAVTITKDYVINPNWDKVDNYFEVYRMKLKDSSRTINLNAPTDMELYHGLVEDTSFSFVANVKYNGENYLDRKVYFNRYNGFVWRRPADIDPSRSMTFNVIGELEQNNWYLLAGLSQFKTLYYVYLDESDSLHVFQVSGMTNY
ncbi:hypothetical protein [Agriterribacter sp.]|uniref:hypothetical protein n=1 Tax=Agriterribacter sp. TaxID=2821509 RepID=UPI002CDEDD83|nr:hypothetical protein [Agriterribacter sp.]HRO46819.1 hypothetical protein [Agriterribacter sp.]HRQ15572.1 hypothetical protein [Agriterribacter sp.]